MHYTLLRNIYDPTSYFTLALFPPHCLHDGKVFKISCTLFFLESTRSGVYHTSHYEERKFNCAPHNEKCGKLLRSSASLWSVVCCTPQCCKAPHFICPLISH